MKPNWYCEKLSCWMMKSACDMRRSKAKLKCCGYENIYQYAGCDTCAQITTREPMEPMEEKPIENKCIKCGQIKPLSEFHKHKQCKLGIYPRCKSCKTKMKKAARKGNAVETPMKKILSPALERINEAPPSDAERGPKDSQGKPDWSVFPFAEAEAVVKVFEYGTDKYGAPFTYRRGIPSNELWSAIMRHLIAIQNGNDIDAESGCLHMAHIAANALMSLSGR